MKEQYIPNARDAVVGYFGRNRANNLRAYCVTCNDSEPLSDAAKIYGDLYVSDGPLGRCDEDDRCDCCGVTFLRLSQLCQREHDEQQARFAREWRAGYLEEYGVRSDIRCRVY